MVNAFVNRENRSGLEWSPDLRQDQEAAQSDIDPALAQQITQAFVSVTAESPAGKAVSDGEACSALVASTLDGWDALEKAVE